MSKNFVCALDYGHGKNVFPPSKGVYKNGKGYHEYDFNSDVGEQIRHILEGHGVKVLVTQPPHGNDVGLDHRTDLANREKADLFASIHANAGVPDAQGACAFAWESFHDANKCADLVVKYLKEQGIDLHGNGRHYSQLGAWTNFHVLRETDMSAILIEHGFMTNDHDFENIFGSNKEDYRRKCAIADAKAILDYFNITYKPEYQTANKGELSMSEYSELKDLINKQNQEIDELKDQLADKMDTTSAMNDPSDTHADAWDWLIGEGITNGATPLHFITREQTGTMLKRYNENNEYLPNWMYDSIVDQFSGIAPYLQKPDEWKIKLNNHQVAVPELLGVFMLGFLNKENTDKVSTEVE